MSSLLERFNRPVVAILVITAVTGILRFWDLGHPTGFVFDEVYYAKAGCIVIGGSDQMCEIHSSDEHYWVEHKWDVGSWVHPPLGKWMTGMGIKAFGMDAFGWRFASAVAGTLIATFVALIAYLLFGSVVWTYVAGLLVAVEHLNHVQVAGRAARRAPRVLDRARVPVPGAGPPVDRPARRPSGYPNPRRPRSRPPRAGPTPGTTS